ncbi:glutaredoxin family protein [Aquitalea palustris]|uniref:Glutaredoxin family protein n=1 Tax=Aquitalea palustris TaxID=2480983 RepID=A0A454JGP3_9NEIS|nr:glutaredoxin family protein [Aquitalea palustris]RMC95714.1 glutaredoxin family protein [Aquitalea palustris]
MKLTLYFREYCSLCHQMLAELQPWQARHGFALEVVDVDADPILEARFNELVPVLMDGEHQICHWHLDIPALAAHLGEIG